MVVKLEPYPFSRDISLELLTPQFFENPGIVGESQCGGGGIHASVEAYPEYSKISATTELDERNVPLLYYDQYDIEAPVNTGLMTYGVDTATSSSEVIFIAGQSYALGEILLPDTFIGPIRLCTYSASLGLTLSDVNAGPIGPRLSPPSALFVNGQDASLSIDDVPAAALVREWEAPALGTADMYVVTLRRVERNQFGMTVAAGANTLRTRDTRIVVPPELVLPGAAYFIRIEAHDRPEGALAGPLRNPARLNVSMTESMLIQIAN